MSCYDVVPPADARVPPACPSRPHPLTVMRQPAPHLPNPPPILLTVIPPRPPPPFRPQEIDINKCTPNTRVALRNDSYTLHKILPTKVDPLVSLMKASQSVNDRQAGGAQPPPNIVCT